MRSEFFSSLSRQSFHTGVHSGVTICLLDEPFHWEVDRKANHEVSMKAFAVETLADATQVLASEINAAEGRAYSLFQGSKWRRWCGTSLGRSTLLRAPCQLASRISAAMKFGASAGEDPFVVVKEFYHWLRR